MKVGKCQLKLSFAVMELAWLLNVGDLALTIILTFSKIPSAFLEDFEVWIKVHPLYTMWKWNACQLQDVYSYYKWKHMFLFQKKWPY